MPGQFRHLSAGLARAGHRVVFVTKRRDRELAGVERVVYSPVRQHSPQTHHYLHQFEDAVLHGQAVARVCFELKQSGFVPDVVIAHPGWGESLFIADVWPQTPILNYGEFYYRPFGTDVNFGGEFPVEIDGLCKLRPRSAHLLLALEAAAHTVCPTEWQKSVHPGAFHDRMSVIFEGIDTDTVTPDPSARLVLPDGRVLTAADEVVTYVARTLEPHRGFHVFMRALPRLCALRRDAQIVIVGGDGPGYGAPAPDGKSWRQLLLEQVEIDPARVHFLGLVPYQRYLQVLQVSSAHVYLTAPFVLSWSAVEALAAGCLVIGSRTPPLEEFVRHGVNGLLVDFFSDRELADTAALALEQRRELMPLRRKARAGVLQHYSLAVCLPRQVSLIESLAGSGGGPARLAGLALGGPIRTSRTAQAVLA